jgi:hypothetical protein
MYLLSNAECQLVSAATFDVGDVVKILLGGTVYLSLTPNDLSYKNSLKLFIGVGAMLGGYHLGNIGADYGGKNLVSKVAGWSAGALIGCVTGAFAGGLGMKIYGKVIRWTYLFFDDDSDAE